MRTRKQKRGGRPLSGEDKQMLEDAAKRRQRPPFRPPSKYASIPDINRKTIKATRPPKRKSVSPPPLPVPAQITTMPEPSVSASVPVPQVVAPPVPAPAPTLEDRIRAAKTVIDMVKNTDIPEVTIVNPTSKFVIVTYWWGRGNLNRNVQHPCAAYINEDKKEILSYVLNYDYIKAIEDPFERERAINKEVEDELKSINESKIKELVKNLKITEAEARERLFKETPALRFEEMIDRFESDCRKANCNFLTMEYPFGRPLYQAAINGKPAFIRKALEVCKGKGPNGTDLAVVYIDGDMRANIYPKIFDMDGIDFMARGWNIDPRSNRKYLDNNVCFDPYVFETSGGIQYFANTPASIDLLDTWELSNIANPGKADDRIISLAFNVFKYQCPLSYIQLPIEYLWLTDNYLFQDPSNTSVEKSIIEHPECLTAEDAAVGAATSRTPDFYTELVESATHCERKGGKFYEYIFFPSEDMVETMGPYLKYLTKAKNANGEKLFEIVPYKKEYGRHQAIAERNIKMSDEQTEVPTTFDIPKILAQLKKGNDVTIGSDPRIEELKKQPLEFIAYNTAYSKDEPRDDEHSMDTTYPDLKPIFDMNKPMFFSAKSSVLYHVLAMCDKPEDLTNIFNESYTFLARVRCYWLK
jgi:hypothetical protein